MRNPEPYAYRLYMVLMELTFRAEHEQKGLQWSSYQKAKRLLDELHAPESINDIDTEVDHDYEM